MKRIMPPRSTSRATSKAATSVTAAFTLIELLIVMGIIAILAAIAIPNYQDALARSKVAKFLGDGKAIEYAIEAYSVDNNRYPPEDYYPIGSSNDNWSRNTPYPATGFLSRRLTTPVAYLGRLPYDPFPNDNPNYNPSDFPERRPYNYSNDQQNSTAYPNSANQYYVSWLYAELSTPERQFSRDASSRPTAAIWVVTSPAVDGDRDHGNDRRWTENTTIPIVGDTDRSPTLYDPTNGTLSDGDLFLFGPGLGFSGL